MNNTAGTHGLVGIVMMAVVVGLPGAAAGQVRRSTSPSHKAARSHYLQARKPRPVPCWNGRFPAKLQTTGPLGRRRVLRRFGKPGSLDKRR